MDATAVQQIQDTVAFDAKRNNFSEKETVVMLPENFKIHDIEKFKLNRNRFRGAFKTTSIADFVTYIKSRKDLAQSPRGFIQNEGALAAKAFFNLGDNGTPGHGDDVSILTLHRTPEYQALLQLKSQMNQTALAIFLQDWRFSLVAFNAKQEEITVSEAINGVRNIKILQKTETQSQQRDTGHTRSALENIEASSTSDNLPSHFTLLTTAYNGLNKHDLDLRLEIHTDGGIPTFTVSIIRHAAVIEEIAQDFKAVITEQLKDSGNFLIGTFEL